jgi:hypothetical protein
MTKSACLAEQRTEVRSPAHGDIWFALEAPDSRQFLGSLVDYSKRGFRAAHPQTSLSAGQSVHFQHSFGEGRALVMWNRIQERHVESGFLILDE